MNELHHLATTLDSTLASRSAASSRAIHARLLKLPSIIASSSLYNKLLHLYWKCGLLHVAHNLFDKMPQRDLVSFNTQISAHLRLSPSPLTALTFYSRLLFEGLRPNCITFTALLSSSSVSAKTHILEQIHCHSTKLGMNWDTFVGSTLVNSYEKCRGLKEALCAFNEIREADSVSWNIMIDVCARRGSRKHSVEVFERMRRECNRGFDSFTLTSVLKTCDGKVDLELGLQLHACALKVGLECETPLGNSLVTMYSRCGGEMDSMFLVFRGIREPNVISWTAMIGGLAQRGTAEEAVKLYKEMVSMGKVENEFLFASVLLAFSKLASIDHGRMVHARIVKTDVSSDISVGNALIGMYFKCGSLEDARLGFSTMRYHDAVSCTVMVNGLGQHGESKEALEMFNEMRARGFRVDDIMLLAGLSACSHGGLVDEGICMFRSMDDDYGIKPRREHFACVVDMLGRAGRLREAEMFIGEMGMESDPFVWEALLGACRIHGEMELGEVSAKKVMELEPQKDGAYVQLANIYADRSLWEEKGKVRQTLDGSGLRKETGWSWS